MGPLVVFLIGGAAGLLLQRSSSKIVKKGTRVVAGIQRTVTRAAEQVREDHEDALAELDEEERVAAAREAARVARSSGANKPAKPVGD
ncbi:hypothetical protein [Pendulispora albinea]|uniref:Secreted protein n=1 Tax=Pendulispora albinea TaxID=2741071 RepID=A0ABZ2LN45_9BACT